MQNDDDNFDDDDMAFDESDDFDSLDDFDEMDGDFDDGDDFSDLNAGDEDEVTEEIDPNLLADNKESFFSKFSFNQLVIFGTLIIGVTVFVFQVVTTKPAVQQDQFRSSVNMSGANDNIVFNNEKPVAPQNVSTEEKNDPNSQGLLNNPDALDSLEIDFDTQLPMPTPIAPKELNDEAILLQKDFEQNRALKGDADIVVADEFAVEDNSAMGGFDDPAGFGDTTMVSNQAIDTPPEEMVITTPDIDIDLNPEGEGMSKVLNQAPKVIVDANNFNITSPVDAPKLEIPDVKAVVPNKIEIAPTKPKAVVKPLPPVGVKVEAPAPNVLKEDTSQLVQEQVVNVENIKNQEILALKQTVEELEKEIAALKKQKAKPAAAKKVVKKVAPKKRAPVVKKASSQWELRAAQPGKAWVSKKGQSELQPVVVGDVIDGIGRIKSISYQKNQWIVTGSTGIIKQ